MTDHCEGCAVREPATTISVGRHLMDVCELCAAIVDRHGDHHLRSQKEDSGEE